MEALRSGRYVYRIYHTLSRVKRLAAIPGQNCEGMVFFGKRKEGVVFEKGNINRIVVGQRDIYSRLVDLD